MKRLNRSPRFLNDKVVRILLALATVTMFVLSAGAPGAFGG